MRGRTEISLTEATTVAVTEETLTAELSDGRTISVLLAWYPRLVHATPEERGNWELIGGGQGIHWSDLDEDISVENLLAGRKSGESQRSFKQWLEAKGRVAAWRSTSSRPMKRTRGGGRMTGKMQVPDGWRWRRLGEVLSLQYGVSLPERARRHGRVPVVGSAGIVGFHDEAVIKGPGIVVGRKGSIGSIWWMAEDFVPIDTTYFVVPIDGKVDLRWAYHYLARENLSRLNRATGVPGLNRDDVFALERSIPPLSEQRAIAAVLDTIDDSIERTEAVIEATEQLRDSLLHELLTRGLPGWHTAWKEVPGLGPIPADWEVVRLGEVAEVVMGQSPPGGKCNRDGDGVPLLNGPTEFGSYYPTPVQWTTDPKKRAGVGDILFCVRGATAGRMNWSDRDYAIGRGIASLKHKGGQAYQRFLRAVIDFRLAELLTVVTGSTFPNLSYDQITQLRVPRVHSPEQQAIADTLEGIDRVLVQRRLERDALRSLKDSTADALLTGLVKAIR